MATSLTSWVSPLRRIVGGPSAGAPLQGRDKEPRSPDATAAAARHASRVARVARALRAHTSATPVSFKKRAVSHQVPKPLDKRHTDEKIDLSDLDEILEIDPVARMCTAEPGVTFVRLVRETLRYGLVPIIVPELKTITIGGAVAGCSLESMSFRYGGFHDTCVEYEVITTKGEVLRCTPDNEHALVFQMIHGSFGTLGVLSKLTFRLVPAKPYVHVRYLELATMRDYLTAIREHAARRDVDFLDGIIHSPTRHVLSVGAFVDEAPYHSRYDWMKVYYQSTAERSEDFLRTPDYYFRYDNGVTNVHPKSAIGRLLFGKFIHSTEILRLADKLRAFLPVDKPDVTVDLFIPSTRVEDFMDWYRSAIGFFPLWCVPYRRVRDYEWVSPSMFAGLEDDLFIDLAIYGLKQPRSRNLYREIEQALFRVQGIKTLISYNYYSEDEFWRIYDRPRYLAVKEVVDPDNVLYDLYDKTCRAARGLSS